MEQRKIFWQEIVDAVKYPDRIIKKENKSHFQKKLERGAIEVCGEKTGKDIKIITVYWV